MPYFPIYSSFLNSLQNTENENFLPKLNINQMKLSQEISYLTDINNKVNNNDLTTKGLGVLHGINVLYFAPEDNDIQGVLKKLDYITENFKEYLNTSNKIELKIE